MEWNIQSDAKQGTDTIPTKVITDKKGLREFIITNTAMQEILNELLQKEEIERGEGKQA
jgi:hypothetical protein